jgi:3D (Asp-Asp-Asp) domain-containing protein
MKHEKSVQIALAALAICAGCHAPSTQNTQGPTTPSPSPSATKVSPKPTPVLTLDKLMEGTETEEVQVTHYDDRNQGRGGVMLTPDVPIVPIVAIPEGSTKYPMGSIVVLQHQDKKTVVIVADTGNFGEGNQYNRKATFDLYVQPYKKLGQP